MSGKDYKLPSSGGFDEFGFAVVTGLCPKNNGSNNNSQVKVPHIRAQ